MLNQPAHANNFNLLRLLAALQVLFVHALNHFDYEGPLVTALKVIPGVPTFFFISGWLICGAYERSRPAGLKEFFRNRFLRIFPALWLSVLVAIGAALALGYLATQSFRFGHFVLWLAGQASIFQFYNPDFMRGFGVGVINGALWTISVELQFYLLAPVLYFLLRRRAVLFALLFAVSLGLNLYFRLQPDWSSLPMKLAQVSFLPWLYMFLTGFLVNAYRGKVDRFLQRVPLGALALGYVASMLLVGSYTDNASNAINPISFILLCGMIVKLATRPINLPASISSFIRRNDLSYGIYLYHMPAINVLLYTGWLSGRMSLLATFLFSLMAAVFSWYVVEKPALSMKRKNDRK